MSRETTTPPPDHGYFQTFFCRFVFLKIWIIKTTTRPWSLQIDFITTINIGCYPIGQSFKLNIFCLRERETTHREKLNGTKFSPRSLVPTYVCMENTFVRSCDWKCTRREDFSIQKIRASSLQDLERIGSNIGHFRSRQDKHYYQKCHYQHRNNEKRGRRWRKRRRQHQRQHHEGHR